MGLTKRTSSGEALKDVEDMLVSNSVYKVKMVTLTAGLSLDVGSLNIQMSLCTVMELVPPSTTTSNEDKEASVAMHGIKHLALHHLRFDSALCECYL